jgi:inosine-uridine nucleoside N-ribohydrolase
VAPTRVLIDTDPGVDDAVAILLALASSEIEVVGLTTVNGNVGIDQTTLNARRLLTLAGRSDVPVARGAAAPRGGPARGAAEVHGKDGLGDLAWPSPDVAESPLSVLALIAQLAAEPLTIVAIGPLTNLAALVEERPDVVARIARVVLMGGASFHGNVTPAAEFNIWVDPEAARVVLAAPWPVVVLPLDLTHQAYLTDEDLTDLRGLGTEVGRRVADMLTAYAVFHESSHRHRNLFMHDATAVYEVIDATAITKEPVQVQIETGGEYSRGATFIHRSHEHADSTVRVGVSLTREPFVALVKDRLASYRDV